MVYTPEDVCSMGQFNYTRFILYVMVLSKDGIISPILFNIYMDDLSMHLNSSGIAGYLETTFLIHLYFADDLCLISLSSSGMDAATLTYLQ